MWCETKPVLFPKKSHDFHSELLCSTCDVFALHSDCFLFLQLEMEDDDVIEVYQEQTGGQ